MKQITTLLLALLLSTAFYSCKKQDTTTPPLAKDKCANVVCYHGNCNDGTCACKPWYEGNNCEAEMRTKFVGRWTGYFYYNDGFKLLHTHTIYTDLYDVSKLTCSLDGMNMSMQLMSRNYFSIPEQTVHDRIFNVDLIVRGNGSISGPNLTMDFMVTDNTMDTTVYHFEGTK